LELSAAPVDLEERFNAFVASHRDRARGLAWRLVGGDLDAAEDVVQDAFVKAYRALGRFREDSSLETWFYRILVNQAHKHRRWRAVRETPRSSVGSHRPSPSSAVGSARLSSSFTSRGSRSAKRAI